MYIFLTRRMPFLWIWYHYGPSPHPTLVKNDPADFNNVFLAGREEDCSSSVFKSFNLILDIATSTFLNIFFSKIAA